MFFFWIIGFWASPISSLKVKKQSYHPVCLYCLNIFSNLKMSLVVPGWWALQYHHNHPFSSCSSLLPFLYSGLLWSLLVSTHHPSPLLHPWPCPAPCSFPDLLNTDSVKLLYSKILHRVFTHWRGETTLLRIARRSWKTRPLSTSLYSHLASNGLLGVQPLSVDTGGCCCSLWHNQSFSAAYRAEVSQFFSFWYRSLGEGAS